MPPSLTSWDPHRRYTMSEVLCVAAPVVQPSIDFRLRCPKAERALSRSYAGRILDRGALSQKTRGTLTAGRSWLRIAQDPTVSRALKMPSRGRILCRHRNLRDICRLNPSRKVGANLRISPIRTMCGGISSILVIYFENRRQ